MKFKNGLMVSAALCAISAAGSDEAGAGASVAADVAEDIKEAGAGVVSFIQQEGALLLSAAQSAGAWLENKLAQISIDAQAFIASAIKQAQADGGSAGEIVANTLTLLYNDGHAIAASIPDAVKVEARAVESSVVSAAAALTTVVPKL